MPAVRAISHPPSLGDPAVSVRLLRLHAAESLEEFWRATQALFEVVTPGDIVAVYLDYFDFTTSWRAATMLSAPGMSKPPEWHNERRQVEVTVPFLARHPKSKFYRVSALFADEIAFQDSLLFREFMRPNGWRDSVGMVYRRGPSVNSVISLRRPVECRGYSAAELRLLAKLHPHFETVINRILRASKERSHLDWLENIAEYLTRPLLRLDWGLTPTYANREALKQCCAWNFGIDAVACYDVRTVFAIPDVILVCCRQLQSDWIKKGNFSGNLSASLTHPVSGVTLKANVALQSASRASGGPPFFTVWFEECAERRTRSGGPAASAILDLLSPAEREIVELLVCGYSNKEAADQLGKSCKTVAGQLTSVYRKVGVGGRARLMASLK